MYELPWDRVENISVSQTASQRRKCKPKEHEGTLPPSTGLEGEVLSDAQKNQRRLPWFNYYVVCHKNEHVKILNNWACQLFRQYAKLQTKMWRSGLSYFCRWGAMRWIMSLESKKHRLVSHFAKSVALSECIKCFWLRRWAFGPDGSGNVMSTNTCEVICLIHLLVFIY